MLNPGTASLVQDKAGKSRVGSDECNPAALEMIFPANNASRRPAKTVSICAQVPSDFHEPDGWLVAQGIDAISVNHDSLISLLQHALKAETRKNLLP